ncbi:MAG: molybdopterin-dependent oxidoreductase [Bryobacteraceae bacterium]
MTRRTVLAGFFTVGPAASQTDDSRNTASSLQAVKDNLTPVDVFFVRDHFQPAFPSLLDWRLRVEGKVARPFDLTFSDLLLEPTEKREALLECAGNGPAGYAVSNGMWEGIPLARLLLQAQPQAGAQEVLLEGADAGKLHRRAPVFPFSRIVPLAKCQAPEAMLAFKLNGRYLARKNGFPARALLPGWYAMDSVKWLRRMVVLGPAERPPQFFESGMTEAYIRVREKDGKQEVARLAEINVKSQVAYPVGEARLPAGLLKIWGFAWSGHSRVRRVSVSLNGGKDWAPAAFNGPVKPFTWVRWSYDWPAKPGEYSLVARAEDESGRVQPLQRDPARKDDYELNHCAPVRCLVR